MNTHSLLEKNRQQKLTWFVEEILKEKTDIIAMQEVNQSADKAFMPLDRLEGLYPIPGRMPIHADDDEALITVCLLQAEINCYWVWLPLKRAVLPGICPEMRFPS